MFTQTGNRIGLVAVNTGQKARVIVVEDNPDSQEGLPLMLEKSGGFECCAVLTGLPSDLGPLAQLHANLLLLDIDLQGTNALDLLPRLNSLLPAVRTAIYSRDDDGEQVYNAIARGADGYVIKGQRQEALFETLNAIIRGAPALCPQATSGLFQFLRRPLRVHSGLELLTAREREILELLARARQSKQIAKIMGIANETVRAHTRNLYKKLDVSNRAELILRVSPQLLHRRACNHCPNPDAVGPRC